MMRATRIGALAAGMVLAACTNTPGDTDRPAPDSVHAVAHLDSTTRLQIMTGWTGVAGAGQNQRPFDAYADTLPGLVVDDLGLNRLQISIRAGMETDIDRFPLFLHREMPYREWRCFRYRTVNDNDDPFVINPDGFKFAELDDIVTRIVLPIQARLAARGERLIVSVTYTAFESSGCADDRYDHGPPEEYAEFILAAFLHLRERYGIEPDYLEPVLEPDWHAAAPWTPHHIGEAIVAAGRRLRAAGFRTMFVAPSVENMGHAAEYIDSIAAVPGAMDFVAELSYHRYHGVSLGALRAIAERGVRYGIRTAMLEHMGAGHEELHEDLTVGHNSAWAQFGLASARGRDDSPYYLAQRDSAGRVVLIPSRRTRFLRQYFLHVREGAQRIGTATTDASADPLAFINPSGRWTVVAKMEAPGTLRVVGLPAGRYGRSYATDAAYEGGPGDTVLTAGDTLVLRIPARGVASAFGR